MRKQAIICPKLKFAYIDAPKCASTSLKRWIYKIEFGQTFQRFRQNNQWKHIHNCGKFAQVPFPQFPEDKKDYKTVTIIRDPIRRFLSAYSNRIVNFKELGEQTAYSDRIRENNLKFDPDINYLVENLEAYQECTNKAIILHHTRPLVDFIGEDLSLYTNIYPIEDIKKIREDLLSDVKQELASDSVPEIPKTQTGGPKLELNILKQENLDRLISYYAQDYATLKDYYSIGKITKEYQRTLDKTSVDLNQNRTLLNLKPNT
ncbi:Sulfotransferase family [Xenococcus sp. PCC 7305]|uniref:sulfotransferase family 2 domain-containing protein n=1 Tax=Xenococcus sp. PCC 7305 TaxID=102125 RepID=UPI0002ACF981|nr:sulfotransferase family 2 domain-containing protein [Xenococcus sp. PCC 7305]ELS01635.1 Sulfotransferase family [Xenococcus sp. PCC 7305]